MIGTVLSYTLLIAITTYLLLKFTIRSIAKTHKEEKQKYINKKNEMQQNSEDELEYLYFAISSIIIDRKMYDIKRLNKKNIRNIDDILKEIYKLDAPKLEKYKKSNVEITDAILMHFIGALTFKNLSELEFLTEKVLVLQPERRDEFSNLIQREKIKKVFIK